MRPAWITPFLEWTESRGAHLVLIMVLVCVLAGALLYLVGWRLHRRALRVYALSFMALPILALGISLSAFFSGWSEPGGFSGTASGPIHKSDGPATSTLTIPIANPDVTQTLELSPFADVNDIARTPVTIHATLVSPRQRIVLDEVLTFAATTTRLWTPIRRTFQTREDGDHRLTLVIPVGVDAVNVEVGEVKKK